MSDAEKHRRRVDAAVDEWMQLHREACPKQKRPSQLGPEVVYFAPGFEVQSRETLGVPDSYAVTIHCRGCKATVGKR